MDPLNHGNERELMRHLSEVADGVPLGMLDEDDARSALILVSHGLASVTYRAGACMYLLCATPPGRRTYEETYNRDGSVRGEMACTTGAE